MLTYNEFEKLIAYYCAPCLMGLKPSSLLSCEIETPLLEQRIHQFHESLSTYPIRIKLLYQPKTRNILFVFNIQLLEKQLSTSKTKEFLKEYDYPVDHNLEDMINYLTYRINKSKEYPHEIGIFLGYPLEDVIGYINNNGKNYSICGYWKVYSNEKSTAQLFQEFTSCRIDLFTKVSQGFTLKELQNLYSYQTNELHKSMLK